MLIQAVFLASAVCFILSLQGLSSHKGAIKGNVVGIVGMFLCIVSVPCNRYLFITIAISIGGIIGTYIAKKISMTELPQLIAGFHSLVGLAAVLVSYSVFISPETFGVGFGLDIDKGSLMEMSIGASIGAITFTGSVVAFLKLKGRQIFVVPGQKYLSILVALLIVVGLIYLVFSPCHFTFLFIVFLSFLLGIFLVSPIGGADMPVVVSMLNSYSGWATSGIGFTLNNHLLIITGALIGTSGAILSYIMCKSMNRSIFNVIFKAFATGAVFKDEASRDKSINVSHAEDAAHMLCNATSVIIVPGYGMAVSQAQHAVRELMEILESRDITVRFAVHPVAGRMPGHMNVLLSEANIDYTKVFELDDINRDFAVTDVVLVVGANDITNPAAKKDKASSIYGMPILEVENARTVFFIKRSMSQGYAGVDNELFYCSNTMMLFGDAKKVVEEVIKKVNEV